jgi:hypothetical protein
MSTIANSLATSLLVSILIASGAPVLSQENRLAREIQSVQEVGDFKFELQGCQRKSQKVICQAWVTANKDVEVMYVGGDGRTTRLIDTSGTQYTTSSIQGVSTSSGHGVMVSLVKDVPMKISATFAGMPTSVQDIALFEVHINPDIKGQFRNIKITESKTGNALSPIKKKK